MKYNYLFLFVVLFPFTFLKLQAQCNQPLRTLEFCAMQTIDFDGDSVADGIINLYDEMGFTPSDGTWEIHPKYATSLDESTGNLSLWNLPNSTEASSVDEYSFQLNSPSCGTDPVITGRIILGPFSGVALPRSVEFNVNAQGCDSQNFDLFSAFVYDSRNPPPHRNGTWTYNGSSVNMISLNGSYFDAKIPYQKGDPTPDQEVFEFTYEVPGLSPCAVAMETTVRIAIVRQVFSGIAEEIQICEDDMIAGVYDADINLRDDHYLTGEDSDNGIWLVNNDVTGQIEDEQDSIINLRTIYNDFVIENGANVRFGCKTFEFEYFVNQRSGVCSDDSSTISFTFYEQLRPFTQTAAIPQICANISPGNFNLFDLIDFTTENGVDFIYDSDNATNWRLLSGPGGSTNDLGLEELINDLGDLNSLYSHLGSINTSYATPGIYTFEYGVSPAINCSDSITDFYCDPFGIQSCNSPCDALTARVSIEILPYDYPGEETDNVFLCESLDQVDLRALLKTNGVNTVSLTGTWTDSNGAIIQNPFTLPTITFDQTFTFTHNTASGAGCLDSAELTFTIFKEADAGEDNSVQLCSNELTITLFDQLGGTPDPTGIWIGPFGYRSNDHLGVFDTNDVTLPILGPGTYIYTVPGNNGCRDSDQAFVTVTIAEPISIGNDRSETFCKLDGSVNLYSLLDRNTPRTGVFTDIEDTKALTADGVLIFETLTNQIYNFEYSIPNTAPCDRSTLIVSVQIVDLPIPVVPEQEFCILDAKRLDDIEVDVLNYNWYASLDSNTPIVDNPLLFDNQVYYIASVDTDNCESERLAVPITILNTGERFSNGELCTLEFQDGVSPNGDIQNDSFALFIEEVYNIPIAFPDFDLQIFNRYGSLVFEGNRNTEEFRGESNVSIRLGDDLPSGTYFYIFNPNFDNNLPIQGSFFLSR
ncbi:gliding motility-associated C-terminal domain-containing protein [Aquimarina sp. W85]|uniref:gliding motility-associated C-terminal domain-containing protein n=1 Tax=Aquimarina rhodophyticola TaxID=3342246 RepID=UPI00366AD492